jgi:DNA-directed RNA polymerase subunit M/transcription elongation factor TFIIS
MGPSEDVVLADPVRKKVIIRAKEIPKIYIFVCDTCGAEEERLCRNADEAMTSYVACKKCVACVAITAG